MLISETDAWVQGGPIEAAAGPGRGRFFRGIRKHRSQRFPYVGKKTIERPETHWLSHDGVNESMVGLMGAPLMDFGRVEAAGSGSASNPRLPS